MLAETETVLTLTDDIVLIGDRHYVRATATLTSKDGKTVQATAFAREEDAKKGMDASQVTGAASSYARKYALNGLFAIDDTEDADFLNTSPQYTQPATATKADGSPMDKAMELIGQAKTKEELVVIYNKFTELQGETDFMKAMTARRKALGI